MTRSVNTARHNVIEIDRKKRDTHGGRMNARNSRFSV